MEKLTYVVDSLENAARQLQSALVILGELDKAESLESFEVGYEQAWIEVSRFLITMQSGRLQKYRGFTGKENQFGLPRTND